MQIPLSHPSIKRSDMDSVLSCMVSDQLGPGVLTSRLVRSVAEYIGSVGGIAVREYGRAVKIVFEALGIKEGDKVLLSPLYPPVYAQVAIEMGIEPMYADVDAETGCISFSTGEKKLDPGIRAIVVYASLGFIPAMDKLEELGIPVIEDLSQAIGGNTGSKRLGSYGSYTIVSMEPEGIFTSGGGVVILGKGRKETNILQKIIEPFQFDVLLSDFNAALGITQIQSIERFIEKRKEIANIFTQALMRSRHRTLIQPGEGENVYYSFPILVSSGLKEVQAYCKKRGIDTALAFSRSILGQGLVKDAEYPTARALYLRCLLFPLYPSLTKSAVECLQKVLSTLP